MRGAKPRRGSLLYNLHLRTLAAAALGLFAATARAEVALPDTYTQLDWIESTGTQYIDTKIPASSGYKFDFDLMNLDTGNDKCVIGYKDDTGYGNMVLPLYYFNGWGYALGTGVWPSKGEARNVRQQVHTEILAESQKIVVGTTTNKTTALGAKSYSGKTLYLFANNQQGTSANFSIKIRLYSCKVWDASDNPVRDFVPCRNEKGEAGLWDLVEGKFYGNKGTGKFYGSDDVAMLDYLKSTGDLVYIDSGYYAKINTYATVDMQIASGVTGQRLFGVINQDPGSMSMYLYTWDDGKYCVAIGDFGAGATYKSTGTAHDTLRHQHTFDALKGEYYIDAAKQSYPTGPMYAATTKPSPMPLGFFFYTGYTGTPNFIPKVTMYGAQFYEYDTPTTKQLVRDYVPWRRSDGTIGFYDLVNETFYPYAAKYGSYTAYAPSAGPLAYMQDDARPTVLKVHDGTLAAEHLTTAYMRRFESISAVEKVTFGTLNAGAVTDYSTPLALSKGVFSLADGAVKQVTVNGALTFAGGATLKIDADATACDSFAAQSLVLANATAENPFVIELDDEGAGTDWLSGATLTVVKGTGLADDDGVRADIRVTQRGPEELAAAVKDGDLVILRKPAPHAIWTGAKGNGDLGDSGNWDYFDEYGETQDRLPDANTDVCFTGSAIPDITGSAPLAAKQIIVNATLADDCDWSGLTLPIAGKIDLKGHKLTVADLPETWEVEITDTAGYERLDYIEAQTYGPYIDTLYTLLEKDVVNLQAYIPSKQSQFLRFFGARNGSGSDNRYEIAINNGGNAAPGTQTAICRYYRKSGNDGNPATDKTFYDQPIDIHCDETCMKWGPAGTGQWTETLAVVDGLGGDCVVSCHVFGTNGSTSRAKGRVYSLKITSGNTVVRDFVPVRRSDGVLGLLDLKHLGSTDAANPEFYANAGTGTFTAGAVTGAIGGGELHVNVAEGQAVVNTTVTLTGTLKLVKEGAGAFVTMEATQTYSGGTDVFCGTVKLGGGSYLGAKCSPITVYEWAVLDIGAGNNCSWIRPVLAGGTLRNSEKDVGPNQEQNAVIALTDDSSIEFAYTGGMIGSCYAATTLDLGGKTLDLAVKSGKRFWLDNADVTAGLFKLSGGGTLAIDKSSLRAAAADFDIASKVTVGVNAEVHDWIVRSGATVSGSGTITVNGTFRPDVDTAAKYALKAGSTLDLEGRSTALNAANLTFPDGGTVFIDLGTRKAKSGPLVSWNEIPANVTFKLEPGLPGRLEVGNDGIYYTADPNVIVKDDKSGRDWYVGDTYEYEVPTPVTEGGTQLVLSAWSVWNYTNLNVVASGTNSTVRFELENEGPYGIDLDWAKNYWLEIVASSNGAITGAESGWFAADSMVVLTPVADAGYSFLRWTGDTEGCVETNGVLLAQMTQARRIGAELSRIMHTVTFDLGEHGTRSGGGELTQTVAHGGAAVAPVVTADTGWTFDGWDCEFADVRGDLTVTARYSAASYRIEYVNTQGVTNLNPTAYTVNDELTFAALPDLPTLRFAGWSPAGISRGTTGDLVVTGNWSNVVVPHQKPDWNAPVNLENWQVIYAKIYDRSRKTYLAHEESMLGAFDSMGNCIGHATIIPALSLFQVNAGFDGGSISGVRLKYWDSERGEIEIRESLTLESGANIGTIASPRVFDVGFIDMEIPLNENFSWISIPLVLDDPSISSVFADCGLTEGDTVTAPGRSATLYGGKWYSSPESFVVRPGETYVVKKSSSGTTKLRVSGSPMNAVASVVPGWNWVGSMSVTNVPVASLAHSGGFADEDAITGQGAGNVSSYLEGIWYGMDTLNSGVGYKIKVTNPGSLSYDSVVSTHMPMMLMAKSTKVFLALGSASEAPNWVSPNNKENWQIIYGRVKTASGAYLGGSGAKLAAFDSEGNCIGVSDFNSELSMFMLNVGFDGGSTSGVTLKYWDSIFGVVDINAKITVKNGENIGTIPNPVVYGCIVEEPIPPLPQNPTADDVKNALDGSADAHLQECITEPTVYNAYRQWAETVKAPGGSTAAGAQAVKDSPNAWLSFALDSATLIQTPPADGDVKVEKFEQTATAGAFDFTVRVENIPVGDDAKPGNLAKVFGIEGGSTLTPQDMSSDKVDITFGTPENGKVKFTAGPKDKTQSAFFMKVKLTP